MRDWSKYIGIPFKKHGRDFAGVDCYGLLCLVLKEEFNVLIPSFTEKYESIDNWDHLKELINGNLNPWRNLKEGQEQPGDGILLRIRGRPIHIAVIIGGGRMLHVEEGINTCIEDYRSFRWSKRILGIGRHEAME